MATLTILEKRLNHLEKEFAAFKKAFFLGPPKPNWLDKIAGSFKGEPEFEEILRLGQEIRKKDRIPKRKRKI